MIGEAYLKHSRWSESGPGALPGLDLSLSVFWTSSSVIGVLCGNDSCVVEGVSLSTLRKSCSFRFMSVCVARCGLE
jgi:hypothetical protein